MAKNKKKRRVEVNNEVNNLSLEGLKRVKVGDIVMYRTKQLFDKCTVESVNKDNNTAKLSNGVTISIGISPNGILTRIGNVLEGTEIKIWDEECDKLYTAFISRRNIRRISESLRKLSDDCKVSSDIIIGISNKLNRIKDKFDLDV